jgi:hypothetical protein
MSWEAAEWAQGQTTGSPYYKGVLLVIATAARDKPIKEGIGRAHQCHLSHATIAKRAECSTDVSQDALDELERRGLLIRKRRYEGGRRTSNALFLNLGGEPLEDFATRVGMNYGWKPKPTKEERKSGKQPQVAVRPLANQSSAGKVEPSLTGCERLPKRLSAGDHSIEPGDSTGERRKHTLLRSKSILPEGWTPTKLMVAWVHQNYTPVKQSASLDDIVARSAKVFFKRKGGTPRTETEWMWAWEHWWHIEDKVVLKIDTSATQGIPPQTRRVALTWWLKDGRWPVLRMGPEPTSRAEAEARIADLDRVISEQEAIDSFRSSVPCEPSPADQGVAPCA